MNIFKDDEFKKHLKICNFKDKVKKILGIEEDMEEEKILTLLETIVSENNRLEDIEDRKVQVDYERVFNKGVKSLEDKIKAEIEKLKDMKVDGEVFTTAVNFAIKELQSLLEKE